MEPLTNMVALFGFRLKFWSEDATVAGDLRPHAAGENGCFKYLYSPHCMALEGVLQRRSKGVTVPDMVGRLRQCKYRNQQNTRSQQAACVGDGRFRWLRGV